MENNWSDTVEYMTVYSKEKVVVTFKDRKLVMDIICILSILGKISTV